MRRCLCLLLALGGRLLEPRPALHRVLVHAAAVDVHEPERRQCMGVALGGVEALT